VALPPVETIDLTSPAALEAALAAAETDAEVDLVGRLSNMTWAGKIFQASPAWLGHPRNAGLTERQIERIRQRAQAAAEILEILDDRAR
jgi:hypothetical protein